MVLFETKHAEVLHEKKIGFLVASLNKSLIAQCIQVHSRKSPGGSKVLPFQKLLWPLFCGGTLKA